MARRTDRSSDSSPACPDAPRDSDDSSLSIPPPPATPAAADGIDNVDDLDNDGAAAFGGETALALSAASADVCSLTDPVVSDILIGAADADGGDGLTDPDVPADIGGAADAGVLGSEVAPAALIRAADDGCLTD